jgi:hypothetical protein
LECEQIDEMAVVENTVYLNSEGHLQELNGTLPNLTRTNTHVGIQFCVYQPEFVEGGEYIKRYL